MDCQCKLYVGDNPLCKLHGRSLKHAIAYAPQPAKCDRCEELVADTIMVDEGLIWTKKSE
jgi:hypothetical protein